MFHRLANGAALKMHLKNIAPLLRRWNACHSQMSLSMQGPGEKLEVVVHESVRKGDSLVTSYLDWFRLLIAHFDAISILIGYVTRTSFKYKAISIKILVAQPVDRVLLLSPL